MKVIIPDISFYQDDNETPKSVDFVKMRAAGAPGVIIRAGQNTWVDPDLADYWTRSKQAGLARGSYWFYDSRTDPKTQAELWIQALGPDLGELPLFADFEEKYGGVYKGWKNWKLFLEELKLRAPGKEIFVYTNFYYWTEAGIPSAEYPYFLQYPLWIAAYETQAPRVPAPWDTIGSQAWVFWQFTDKGDGKLYGAESNRIDLNYFYGELDLFKQRFNLPDSPTVPEQPSGDKSYNTHEGVTVHVVQRFGSKCVVHLIDTKKARVFVTGDGFKTVGAARVKHNANIAMNGGGWPNVQTPGHRANEIWCSDGALIQATAKDDRGYINVSAEGLVKVSENARLMAGLRNAWGFDRILGKDGSFNTRISDRTTKDARTGSGITADGKLIILSAEGNDRFQNGLSFPEMWEVFEEFGAVIAGNNDGGSSSAVINDHFSGQSIIIPSDGHEANVINHVLIYAVPIDGPVDPEEPENPEEPMADRFIKINISQKERKSPSMFETDSRTGMPAGKVVKIPAKVPAVPLQQDLIKDPSPSSDALFFKTESGYYQPAFYKGSWFVTEVQDPTTPTDPEVPFPGNVQDMNLTLAGITFGRVILNGEEWVRKI